MAIGARSQSARTYLERNLDVFENGQYTLYNFANLTDK